MKATHMAWAQRQNAFDMPETLADSAFTAYFQEKTVLVTGAAGFIGGHLIRRLQALGARIIAVDRISGPALPGVTWLEADVLGLAPEHVTRLTPRVDSIFHLAAILGVSYTGQNPTQTLAVNAIGTSNVLKLARRAGTRTVCILSSSEVYGEAEVTPISESCPLRPLSIYGWSKVCAEHMLDAYTLAGDLSGIIIRPFNVYGPGQRSDFVISRFLRQAIQGQPLTIVGTGQQQRTFTYISDFISGVLLAVMQCTAGCSVYNIAGDETISIADLAEMIRLIVGSRVLPVYLPASEAERDSATEIVMRVPDITKARQELHYQPLISLRQGVSMTYTDLMQEKGNVLQ